MKASEILLVKSTMVFNISSFDRSLYIKASYMAIRTKVIFI